MQLRAGFTLVELLVVITILVILASIGVFAAGGIGDRGLQSACRADTKALMAAEEAHFASSTGVGLYAAQGAEPAPGDLLSGGFLLAPPTLHTVLIGGDPLGSEYEIVDAGNCGPD